MDSKISPSTFFIKPSGTFLLILLIILLNLLGLGLARLVGQSIGFGLTLMLPLGISATISAILGYWIVPLLRRFKTGQIIQEDGPQAHLSKAGTPTMGGIFFIPVGVTVALVWTNFEPTVVAVSAITLAYLGIGWIDDWQVLRQKSNKGISPWVKLILQIVLAIVFCFWVFQSQPSSVTDITLPGNLILHLGLFFWLLAGFVLVAESNATNLTDGVDGLAAGSGSLTFLGLGDRFPL